VAGSSLTACGSAEGLGNTSKQRMNFQGGEKKEGNNPELHPEHVVHKKALSTNSRITIFEGGPTEGRLKGRQANTRSERSLTIRTEEDVHLKGPKGGPRAIRAREKSASLHDGEKKSSRISGFVSAHALSAMWKNH